MWEKAENARTDNSLKFDSIILENDNDIASSFAECFKSVFGDEPCDFNAFDELTDNLPFGDEELVEPQDIVQALAKLKPKRSVGPACIQKTCGVSFLEPLLHISRLAFAKSIFPTAGK